MEKQTTSSIQWKQMISLLGLYASVIIGWIAYHRYQPALLDTFNMNDFEPILIWGQAIILILTPPLAGYLGDKYRHKLGNRLRIVTLGVSFAAMIFMTVAFTLIVNPPRSFVLYALPVLVILWLFAMSLFTSPAISTIEMFTPTTKLPITVAALTITSDLLYSLEPVIVDIIDFLGGAATFAVGGIIVSISGYLLRKYSLEITDKGEEKRPDELKPKTQMWKVILLGVGMGLFSGFIIEVFPNYLDKLESVVGISGQWISSLVLVLTAIFSVIISRKITDHNIVKLLAIGLVFAGLSTIGIFTISDNQLILAVLIIFALFYAMVNVTALPLALQNTSVKEKVFGVGVFFCGFEIPNSVIDVLLI
ncbi:MFS transporter [Marivirga arenosa]|uniref:MFS transporter n=1 Tax=Marivirga arenosa TaxID=3059076 RepID=A0AA51ZV00_9BACT|nr:MFS transporter [Marivirga sp. BKB1-2]WNB16797.1 MFS transporter [Marivirga sp. BKB1-2]